MALRRCSSGGGRAPVLAMMERYLRAQRGCEMAPMRLPIPMPGGVGVSLEGEAGALYVPMNESPTDWRLLGRYE